MKKRRFSVAVAIFLMALAFSGCEYLKVVPEEIPPETYDPLIIKGTDKFNSTVVITFTTTRGPPSAKMPMTSLMDHDSYEIKVNNTVISQGEILMDGTGWVIRFIPVPREEGESFRATLSKDKNSLRFLDPTVPTKPPIIGYQSDLDDGANSPDAKAVAELLNKSGKKNAKANGDDVVINGPIDIDAQEDITIPDGLKLRFNSRDDDLFTITGVKVIA